jgi:hypothetical protein
VLDYEFGLSPAGTHNAHAAGWMHQSIMQQQCAYGVAFARLTRPPCGNKLVVLELFNKLKLVGGGVEAQVFSAELLGVCWERGFLGFKQFLFHQFEFCFLMWLR